MTTRKTFFKETKKKSCIKASTRCTELLGCVKDKNWSQLLQKLEYHENDAREWIEELNDDGTTRWKSLLIHLVSLCFTTFTTNFHAFCLQHNFLNTIVLFLQTCEWKPPLEVVRQLVRIYPMSVEIKNSGGDLPIHIACRVGASHEVIEVLLDSVGFESAQASDCEGRLPLHLAASNNDTSTKTIQTLLKVYDRATRLPDDFGLLPLHWACSKNASPRTIETIIQAYPYAVEANDAWGRQPEALAKLSKNPEKAQVLELLQRDVSSWSKAMMSTVVTLSNKVMAGEKMEVEFKSKVEEIEHLKDVINSKDKHIETLQLEIEILEERFVNEMEYLKDMHNRELETEKMEWEEITAQLRKDNEEAERRLEEMKHFVDEVVEQLKEHQHVVSEKEAGRKDLKHKAVALIQRLDSHKAEARATYEENERLKMERSELQEEVRKRDNQLKKLKSSFKQSLNMLDEVRSESNNSIEDFHGDEEDVGHNSNKFRHNDRFQEKERNSRGQHRYIDRYSTSSPSYH